MLDTDPCEFARSATTQVQFTDSDPEGELLPHGQAPCLNEQIEIIPEPVTRGVPTVLRATIVNPSAFPLVVDGSFSYAQPGIGLTFGPIGEVLGCLVPAGGESVLEVERVQPVSAKYCIEFQYTSRRDQGRTMMAGSGRSQRNLSVGPAPSSRPPGRTRSRRRSARRTRSTTLTRSSGWWTTWPASP